MKQYLLLLRPLQWLKNVFVFAPLFFSNSMLKVDCLIESALAFASFCLMSSAVYCLNDIQDAASDRLHPQKRLRPVASGQVSVGHAYAAMALAIALSVLTAGLLRQSFVCEMMLLGYLLLNVAYCLKLKQYAIIDVTVIAVGFVLRVLIGGLATGIWVSHWLVLLTFLLTLMLALGKRDDDFRIFEQTGEQPRKSITGYNRPFIRQAVSITSAIVMVCYVMYTMSPEVIERLGTPYVYLTSVWVLAGLLRYIQNTTVYSRSGSPTKTLVRDRFLQLCIAGWIVSFIVILYC